MTTTTLAAVVRDRINEIRNHTPGHLARLAECSIPHTAPGQCNTSTAGAQLLRRVASDTADTLADLLGDLGPEPGIEEYRAALAEWIDGETPDHDTPDDLTWYGPDNVHTGTMWAEFIDLAAWSEEVDLGELDGSTLSEVGRAALRQISRRLVDALAGDLVESLDDLAADLDPDDDTPAASARPLPTVRQVAATFGNDPRVAAIVHPSREPETVTVDLAGGAFVTLCDVYAGGDAAPGTAPGAVVGYSYAVTGPDPDGDAHAADTLDVGGDGFDPEFDAAYSLPATLEQLIEEWHHAPGE